MTKEDRERLLKDLGGRLPYGVKILDIPANVAGKLFLISTTDTVQYETADDTGIQTLYNIKPYLLPLSSMTEEQLFEVQEIMGKNEIEIEDGFFNIIDSSRNTITYLEILAVLEWFYKNHFDINGLIEKGLAIDATGLNIY